MNRLLSVICLITCIFAFLVELTEPSSAFVRLPLVSRLQSQRLVVKVKSTHGSKSMPRSQTRHDYAPSHAATAFIAELPVVPLVFLVRAREHTDDFVLWYPRPIDIPPVA